MSGVCVEKKVHIFREHMKGWKGGKGSQLCKCKWMKREMQ